MRDDEDIRALLADALPDQEPPLRLDPGEIAIAETVSGLGGTRWRSPEAHWPLCSSSL